MDKEKDRKQEIDLSMIPPINDLRMELAREEAKYEFRRALLNIAGALTVAAAIAALLLTRFLILLQVNGSSMMPTLADGEIVILRQTKEIEKGDIIGFYYGGKILLKRVTGSAGDEIDIDQEGNVYVNGTVIDEPYVSEKKRGKCDQDFPYQIPEEMVFVLGDNRAVSIDSRMKSIGCVERGQIVGKVVLRAWPLAHVGMLH
ncbi:signal peptidase I [Dorea sp. 5-2]|nr:signal peptidase I [Dorea sp. 5-2]